MPSRGLRIGQVVEHIAVLGREMRRARSAPFAGRVRTAAQLEALFVLAHAGGPLTPGELADELGVTPGAVTQVADRLDAEGLVERAPHPTDARSKTLRLSRAAAAEVARYEASVATTLEDRFGALGDGELGVLADLLEKTRRPASPEPIEGNDG
ncbi:hypothetical protein DSM26151_00810 [Agromyces marinus]|nr:hypothetical protein DSM26151_00810 [Agromyces marinus]